jgi:hypothetical protein
MAGSPAASHNFLLTRCFLRRRGQGIEGSLNFFSHSTLTLVPPEHAAHEFWRAAVLQWWACELLTCFLRGEFRVLRDWMTGLARPSLVVAESRLSIIQVVFTLVSIPTAFFAFNIQTAMYVASCLCCSLTLPSICRSSAPLLPIIILPSVPRHVGH